jgi:Mor family transcriptional regulator
MQEQIDIPDEYRWLLTEPADRVAALVPPQVAELVELVGVEGALRIVHRFAGQQLYVHKPERAFRRLREERLRAEFTGANHAALARRYGMSVSHVYDILRRPDAEQGELFGGREDEEDTED